MVIVPDDIEDAKSCFVLRYTKEGMALAIPVDSVDNAVCVVEKLDPVTVLKEDMESWLAAKLDPDVVDKLEATVESPTSVVLRFDPMTVLKEDMES